MERKRNNFQNNTIADLLFPDSMEKSAKRNKQQDLITPVKFNQQSQMKLKEITIKKEERIAQPTKLLQLKRQRSYSPTSSNVNNQAPVKIAKIIPIQKPIENKQDNCQKKSIIPIIHKKTINTEELKLVDKLKNFSNLDDLCNDIEKNKNKYKNLFPAKEKYILRQEIKAKEEKTKGLASLSFAEQRKLQKIDEMNNILLRNTPKMAKTKYITKISSDNKEIYYNSKERFCTECLCMHIPNEHIRKRYQNIDYNKIFGEVPLQQKKNEEENNNKKLKEILVQQQLKKEKERKMKAQNSSYANKNFGNKATCNKMLQKIHKNDKMSNNKKEEKKMNNPLKSNGFYSKEDFEDEQDNFIDNEDSDMIYMKYLEKIKRSYNNSYSYGNDDDGDIEETTFDGIQREEERTAQIGDYEDEQEELREKQRLEKRSHK